MTGVAVGRLFGTDGVRGRAGVDLTVELALRLSRAAASSLASTESASGERPFAIVGRDPRPSGEGLEAAVVAGLSAAGVDAVLVGVLPTPAVAHLTATTGAAFGVMLSASHNPMPDNGIKFFAPGGRKLDDALEDAITAAYEQGAHVDAQGSAVGRVRTLASGREDYLDHLLAGLPHRLDGLKVVVDCANGAAASVAPEALRRAGAEVVALFQASDGVAINEACGSTHPEALQAAVLAQGADAGIALDGDADRCLAVDAAGALVDGDQILAVLARAMHARGTLAGNTLVATVMSNLALHHAMTAEGIELVTTAVGDRYVLEAMASGGFNLGGEQSGHVVLGDHATTGDGTLTALHLLGEVAARGATLAEVASIVRPLPQVLVNVSGVRRDALADATEVHAAVAEVESTLAGSGRVLLRPSGTEPLIRVMVEAGTHEEAVAAADRIAAQVRLSLS
jgi:phosphoglucosamine mutase